MYSPIKSFNNKMVLFESHCPLKNNCFAHFDLSKILIQQKQSPFPIKFAVEALSELKKILNIGFLILMI